MKETVMDNRGRARRNRQLERFASAAVVFAWLAVILELVTTASRNRLLTAGGLYQTVGAIAMAWFVMLIWTTARQNARSGQVINAHGAWGRAAGRIEAVVTTTEKALFRWTPYLSAVFWALYGYSLNTTAHAGWGPEEQSVMYFMVAIVFTTILMKGIAELRPRHVRGSPEWRRVVASSIIVGDAALALAAGYFIWKFGSVPLVWATVALFAALGFFITVGGLREIRAAIQQEPRGLSQGGGEGRDG